MALHGPAPVQGYQRTSFLLSLNNAKIQIPSIQGVGGDNIPPPPSLKNWVNGPDNLVNSADNVVASKGV